MTYEFTPQRLRLIVKILAKKNITTEQAEQFLSIFGEQLTADIDSTVRAFVAKKFR